MPNPTRLLRRGPHVDEAEIEAARSHSLARLSEIVDHAPTTAPDVASAEDAATPVPAAPAESLASVDDVSAEMTARAEAPAVPAEAFTVPAATGIAADAEPDVQRVDHGPGGAATATAMAVTIDLDDADGANGGGAARIDPGTPIALPVTSIPVMAEPGSLSADADDWDLPVPDVGEAASRPRPAAPRRPVATPSTAVPVGVIASCPYCALLLEPPPEADRRCARCRQRIIVRHVQGRAVYLTEAAVEVFEAERRRIANTGRWTRDRERWLKLAVSVGAPAGRIARLERAVLSDAVLADAHALFETTVERQVRAAKRDHRWDDAARLRRDQALALYRMAGSPVPPLEELVTLHRDGASAALHGLDEIAKEAELIGADCCDACRADDRRRFRISRELREPRLPHAGCPKGLCRCRWELTARDRNLIGGYLRRHARPDRAAPSA